MQVIAIRFNREVLGNEAYEELKGKLAKALKNAIGNGEVDSVLSLEMDDSKEQEHAFLLRYNQQDQLNPDRVRNAFLEKVGFKIQSDIRSSKPDLGGTDPFHAIPQDGQSHEFAAIRILPHKDRPQKHIHDPLWAGNEDHAGIKGVFADDAFLLNLTSSTKTWLAVFNAKTGGDIVRAIYDRPNVAKAIKDEKAKRTPDSSEWNKLSPFAITIPSEQNPDAVTEVKITAQHLTI